MAFVVGPAWAEPQVHSLTVEDAVLLAIASNAHLLARQARVRGAREHESSATGRMLPSVHFFDEYEHYNSSFYLNLGALSSASPPTSTAPGFRIRGTDTNTLSVSADQPLLGLFPLSHERAARARAADATEADLESAQADVREAVEVGYLHLFEAKALEDIAKSSEDELADQVQVTRARVSAGELTNADLLRVQVAVANAKQQEILAHTQGQVAQARLLATLGLPTDAEDVEFVEPTSLLANAAETLPLKEAQRLAASARPELKQLRLQVESLDHTRRARLLSLLPDIDAEAAYNHLDGQLLVAPPNSVYVGLKANWNVWDWGATWHEQRAAAEQTNAAQHDLEDESRQIGLEVATSLAEAHAATSAVDVARETIASAEEAYRVTEALLKAGAATTTDLLDSQAALTQARLNLIHARYEQALAQVAVARSVGR
jgi:outer membrane protein TolC